MRAALQKVVDDFNLDINDPFTRIIAAAFAFQDERDAANARIRELEAAQQAPTSEEVSRMIESLECCEFPVADEAAIFIRRLDRERQELQTFYSKMADSRLDERRRAERAEAALAEARKDADYFKWRLKEILPLFEEARDALCAIRLPSAKLHKLNLSLGDLMDAAGTRTREQFDAAIAREGQTK